jgi:dGTPase
MAPDPASIVDEPFRPGAVCLYAAVRSVGAMEDHLSDRARTWAATMSGHVGAPSIRTAHAAPPPALAPLTLFDRAAREEAEAATLARGATLAHGSGHRLLDEAPDPMRTCFERDRDRILHTSAFRRLAGKTQVFVLPADHQRTRLTHALEVAQVARSIAGALRLNVALAEAIALGHDCGHGPGGHASEDALSPYLAEGYDHAVWGADVALADLNLCAETLDGIRNHSWSRPVPATPEGAVVSWADRIAYVCHDFEDAVAAGIVTVAMLPEAVVARCGSSRREQLAAFIDGVIDAVAASGVVGMLEPTADALAGFRKFNYEKIYLREASRHQAALVVDVLQALVEHYAASPQLLPVRLAATVDAARSPAAHRAAVTYVGGMTDRFAFCTAQTELGWAPERLPHGIDTAA